MATLERAIQIAYEAHVTDEPRRSGEDYITHPLAVMEEARKLGYSVTRQIIAVLHDVPENNPDWPVSRIREEGFSEDVAGPLERLRKDPDAEYSEYIRALEDDPDAVAIKVLDMKHNLRDNPTERQVRKYHRALFYLATKQEVLV